jgi:hypothetical protein
LITANDDKQAGVFRSRKKAVAVIIIALAVCIRFIQFIRGKKTAVTLPIRDLGAIALQ